MKGEKTIILLNSDHTISKIKSKDFVKGIDLLPVEVILFPCRMYDNIFYLPVSPYMITGDFSFELTATPGIYNYAYGEEFIDMVNISSTGDIHLQSNTIPDFYKIVASLTHMNMVNSYLNPSFADEFFLFGLDKCMMHIKYDSYEIHDNVETSPYRKVESDERLTNADLSSYSVAPLLEHYSPYNVAYLIEHLGKLVRITKNGKYNGINDLMYKSSQDIEIKDGAWEFIPEYTKASNTKRYEENEIVIGSFMDLCGCYTFIPQTPFVMQLLNNVYDVKLVYDVVNIDKECRERLAMLDVGESIDCYFIEDNEDMFEVFVENVVPMYRASDIIQLISNIKYIAKSYKLCFNTYYGELANDIVFTILCHTYRSNANKKLNSEFKFGFLLSEIDNMGDIFQLCIDKLAYFMLGE